MPSCPHRLSATALAAALLLSSCSPEPDAGDSPESPGLTAEEQAAEELAERAEEITAAEERINQALAGPDENHRDAAAEIVSELSLDQMAGQVIVGEYHTTDSSEAAELVEQLHLAGMIVMGENVPTGEDGADLEQLATELERIQQAAEPRGYPALISVDQEGGLVTRIGQPLTEWPAPMAAGAAYLSESDAGPAAQAHRFMAQDLRELGFTATFAPPGDVTVGAADPTIGSRAFGADPEAVSMLAVQAARGLADAGLAGSVKHFPGHGSVTEDSHHTLPVQDADLEELQSRDWVPFAQSAEAGVPMVMMGHIEVPALQAGVPSSLSPAAYQALRDLGHDGVVVTDAMNMAAVLQHTGETHAAVQALAAGADLILMPADIQAAHAGILEAVEAGDLEHQRLTEAAERVVALMLWQQDLAAGDLHAGPGVEPPAELIDPGAEFFSPPPWTYPAPGNWTELAEASEAAETPTGQDLTRGELTAEEVTARLASASVTLVTGECGADLTDEGIQILGGTEQDRARLAAAAEAAGVPVGSGTVVTLLGGSTPGSGDVVVALDRPEVLAEASAETRIALYGRTEESFAALIEVLTGAEAPGMLPVEVGDHPLGHSAC
ncbi:glycoside hydrolase family 3 N-terminal domain-containing protein [Nesterenkonia alba]|uniref:glycoside hydrolase family 3 N-terminal domain-containing protein n=1 Tax=Nesterenkonia alba TaxID=515814 RepID=UPI0003B307A5|nr:glycoside hydrolase family 3 N-terminal domain-containing protein [Nesterenkonia alba]